MRLINPSSGAGSVGPALAGITSVTSPTGQTLTLATLDTNQDVIVAPHGTGRFVAPGGKMIVFSTASNSNGIQLNSAGGQAIDLSGNDGTASGVIKTVNIGLQIGNGNLTPGTDNNSIFSLGRPTFRWYQGYFGSNGIRIGDGTNGANISATGSAGSESLVLRGAPYVYDQTLKYLVQVQSPLVFDILGTGVAGSTALLVNNGTELQLLSGNRFGYSAFRCGSITADTAFAGQSVYLSAAAPLGGGGSSSHQGVKPITGILNATATAVATITVANSAQSAAFRVTLFGQLGAGGSIGAGEGVAIASYDLVVTRTANLNAVAAIAAATGAAAANVTGGQTLTLTAALGAVVGANNVTNTIPINATLSRSGAGATNHTCFLKIEALNSAGSGVTIA